MDSPLYREAIIGFAVIQYESADKKIPRCLQIKPITMGYGEPPEDISLNHNQKIVSIIPAPPGSYAVYGEISRDAFELLGYEFTGASCPDWTQELLRQRQEKSILGEGRG